jgi:hypothetical protein
MFLLFVLETERAVSRYKHIFCFRMNQIVFTMNENLSSSNRLTLVSVPAEQRKPRLRDLLRQLLGMVYQRLKMILWSIVNAFRYSGALPPTSKWIGLALLALLLLNADFDYAFRFEDRHGGTGLGYPVAQSAGFENSEFAPADPQSLREKKVLEYIDRYASIAIGEMQRTGVPASITLAQAIIESRSGESRLAAEINNHFGIKCFSKTCKKGHCRNFSDDHHKDFFRRFASVEDSYRAHSEVVLNPRYTSLLRGRKDHASWARALEAGGYATGSRYAEKLCSVIARYRLARFDR